MKGYLFGPTRKSEVIKEIDVNIRIPKETTVPLVANTLTGNSAVINIKPGMLANGSPTSNATLSVANDQINANNNYGFLIDFTENM